MTLKKGKPGWRDVKGALVDFDRAGLLALVQDMYAASKDNQVFLHARFGLGEDALEPYRVVIERWLCPDVYKNQDYSVAKARKPIADYKKAIGLAAGPMSGIHLALQGRYGLSAAQLARANVRYCLQAYAAAVVWLAVIGSVLGVRLLPAWS